MLIKLSGLQLYYYIPPPKIPNPPPFALAFALALLEAPADPPVKNDNTLLHYYNKYFQIWNILSQCKFIKRLSCTIFNMISQ